MSRHHRPVAGALLLLVGTAVAALAAQKYAESTSTVVVEVPVQVVRDGEPVRGLTKDDFEVYDGRHQQTITGFDVVDLGQPAAPKQIPTAAARRHFLVLFDLAFSDLKGIAKARDAVRNMVASLHPTDLIGVATYSSIKGPQMILGFTSDRHQIDVALKTLGAPEMLDMNPDPLRLALGEAKAEAGMGEAGSSAGAPGRSGGTVGGHADEMVELLGSMAQASQRAAENVQRTAVVNFTKSVSNLAHVMAGINGRKYIVYLSQGFDSSLLQGTNDAGERADNQQAMEHGEIWKADSINMYGDTKALNATEKMLEELRRADCVVESVDVGGLAGVNNLGVGRSSSKDTLLDFAKSTGGELYENFNDLGQAMGQMLARTSVSYVLVFQPDKIDWDGSFHKLKVELKNQPRGTRVVFRPGYYAPVPYEKRSALEKLVEAQSEMATGSGGGSIAVDVLAAPFAMPSDKEKNAKAYVPVLMEIDGPTLLGDAPAATVATEVYAYAFDAKGGIADHLSQVLGFEVAKVPKLQQKGLKYFGHLELPPGDYSVRVLVRNAQTGNTGMRVVPVHVPAFDQRESALLPPFVPTSPEPWLITREAARGEYQQAPYPFLLNNAPYIPASLPEMKPGKEAQIALVGYALPDGQLATTARVLASDGHEVAPATIQVLAREKGVNPSRLIANVTPPQLAPGEYTLEVKVASGAATQTSTTLFVVRNGR